MKVTNPVLTDGDYADPFVLKHNGIYYLYSTTPRIECWSSKDLVTWESQGMTLSDEVFPDLVPFAPEVTYWNGKFYMYTSPSGHGHYVLESASPTGPFEKCSPNIGLAIDGNVFIDNDGRWYFYWAGDEGIWGCEMPTPVTFGKPVLTGAFMHGWTEGPFVSRRGASYHMTLTGNHYLSAGYRINAAVSDSPLGPFVDNPLNPLLIATGGDVKGLGHSSSVRGPDLASTYMVYHNMNPDLTRHLDLDRQVWSKDLLWINGPSKWQPSPEAATFVCDWHDVQAMESGGWTTSGAFTDLGGQVLVEGPSAAWTSALTGDYFISEINLCSTSANGSLLVEWKEMTTQETQLLVRFCLEEGVAEISGPGVAEPASRHPLPAGIDLTKLQVVRFEYTNDHCVLYVNALPVFTIPVHTKAQLFPVCSSEGTELILGHSALANVTANGVDQTLPRTMPGTFIVASAGSGNSSVVTAEGLTFETFSSGAGESLIIPIAVQTTGDYDIAFTGEFSPDAVFSIGEGSAASLKQLSIGGGVGSARIHLDEGVSQLVVVGESGRAQITLCVSSLAEQKLLRNLDSQLAGSGKKLFGSVLPVDSKITARVQLDEGRNGDVLIRASQLSEGGEGGDVVLGRNFLIGYSIQFRQGKIRLARHSYDEKVLAEVAVSESSEYEIEVDLLGCRIKLVVNGQECIDHFDPFPILFGTLGLRAKNSQITLSAVSVN